jgi:Family of unknown function (DUF5681)
MAFKKGISGNPGGKSGDKIFTDALRLEVNRVDPKNRDRKKINALAEKLVNAALIDGEGWAFQQIADRLEGKPAQPVEPRDDDRSSLREFTDAELTAIMRGRLKAASVESDEERPDDEPLN